MDEERDWFAEMISAEDDAPAVDEAATEAAAPEVDASPDAIVADTPLPESDPVAAIAAEPEPEPTVPAIDWEHPELKALREQAERDRVEAEQNRAIKAQLAQIQRQKAATDFQAKLAELADGDPERLQQLNGVIAQVATPAVQQMQAAEQQASSAQKLAAAMWIAAQANLSDEQIAVLKAETDALMAVEGPDLMQQTAFGKREFMRQNQAAIAERDKRIAELEAQIAAGTQLAQREASGADAVDSGQGGIAGDLTRDERMRRATNADDYFAGLFGRAA